MNRRLNTRVLSLWQPNKRQRVRHMFWSPLCCLLQSSTFEIRCPGIVLDPVLAYAGQQGHAGMVTAVEAFPPMAALAKAVVAANELTSSIQVIHKHSTDLTISDSPASGIVTVRLRPSFGYTIRVPALMTLPEHKTCSRRQTSL